MRWLKEGQFEKAFKKKEELKYECGGEESVEEKKRYILYIEAK